ncbi:hypothetical protein VCRA2123E342_20510 [Vibrio crassostreae]|nr:hypothetical protein VCRA2123E342_20510 [Vibrio crassostreae]
MSYLFPKSACSTTQTIKVVAYEGMRKGEMAFHNCKCYLL